MEAKRRNALVYFCSALGFVAGVFLIGYAFEQVSIPHVHEARDKAGVFMGVVVCFASIVLGYLARSRSK